MKRILSAQLERPSGKFKGSERLDTTVFNHLYCLKSVDSPLPQRDHSKNNVKL